VENVTPEAKLPEPVSEYVPPATMTRMLVGAQPPVSVYRTEKRKDVVVVPLPGDAAPADRLS